MALMSFCTQSMPAVMLIGGRDFEGVDGDDGALMYP